MTTTKPLKTVMTTAWQIARAGAIKFGGKARSYLSAAMRQAWQAIKAPVNPQLAKAQAIIDSLKADGRFVGKLWANYDKVRVYVETYGYIAIGKDGTAYPSLRRYSGNITTAAGIR